MCKNDEYYAEYKESQRCTRNYKITVIFNQKAGRLAFYNFGKPMCKPTEDVFGETLFPLILYRGKEMELTLNWTADMPISNEEAKSVI